MTDQRRRQIQNLYLNHYIYHISMNIVPQASFYILMCVVKDYELRVLRLQLNFFYSDASITKAVLSVWELLLEWQLS